MDEIWPVLLLLGLGLGVLGGLALCPRPPAPAILKPLPGETLGLPAEVSLAGLPDGAEVGVRLVDSFGRVLVEDSVRFRDDRAGKPIYYDVPGGEEGRLELFVPAPGYEERVLRAVPVRFGERASSWIKVFFYDREGRLFPLIRRIPRTPGVATQALRCLLLGPTWRERVRGFWSAIPEGTEIVSLTIDEGVARVRLSFPDPSAAGPAVPQVEATLLQFPTVSSVEVTH